MSTGTGSDRQVRNITILGLVFAVAGFVAIGLGWNGMARRACVDCQLPYLLSGGAAGLGLIVFGGALLLIGRARAERIKADARIEELIRATGRVGSAIASANGAGGGQVVAGRSTYHRPDCRLVQGKDLERVTAQVAAASGLSPCRVCSPEVPDEGEAEPALAPAGATGGGTATAPGSPRKTPVKPSAGRATKRATRKKSGGRRRST